MMDICHSGTSVKHAFMVATGKFKKVIWELMG